MDSWQFLAITEYIAIGTKVLHYASYKHTANTYFMGHANPDLTKKSYLTKCTESAYGMSILTISNTYL